MERSVRVTIAGREYVLRGEDEEKLLRSAREVDGQWQRLRAQIPEQSTTTMAILVALNLAEQHQELRAQYDVDMRYIGEALDRMIAYVDECLSAPGVDTRRPDIVL
ncbi:MAG: cell division protein ZapA [Candidatus Kapabacteria bacterium]|nr:cell division protein ZapA [Candidatus Kapabacteria bacterium]MDW7997442.1 cell division protein ZapA [Bacteroidota bacterium]MDW8224497.1 cell division protein ZapA [Bacteroidota bacterium]